mgnify:FL=1
MNPKRKKAYSSYLKHIGTFLIFIIIFNSCQDEKAEDIEYINKHTKIIAHRGYWNIKGSTENSISSLTNAQMRGFYGSEFDVFITSDGIPVISHEKYINKMIIEDTPYKNIKNYILRNGEILPTLERYLIVGAKHKETKLILEIKPLSTKDKEDDAVKIIRELVGNYNMDEQVNYISFSLNICTKMRKLNPSAKIFYTNGDLAPSRVKELGLSGISYNYSIFNKNIKWIKEAKNLGLMTNVWVVNDVELMKEFLKEEVDFITTDEPVMLTQVIRKNTSK